MRGQMIPADVVLERVLAGLEPELVAATDEEIVQAARDLGMDVKMKGSAAFMGVTNGMPKHLEDFFGLEELRKAYTVFIGGQRLLPKRTGEEGDEEA